MKEEEIINILENKCSKKERADFFDRIAEDEDLMRQYINIKNKYVLDNLPNSAMGGIRNLVLQKANVKQGYSRRQRYLNNFYKIAALFIIPLTILLTYKYSTTTDEVDTSLVANVEEIIVRNQNEANLKYYVDSGVKGYVDLPDGSKVWLNSSSEIEFPARFDSLNRVVNISGEAYFDVVSDKDWPFIIHTPREITTIVTGTTFNLSCYKDDNYFKLTLISGSLTVQNEKDNKYINVKPLQEVIISDFAHRNNKFDVNNKITPQIETTTAWKEGILVFDNTYMSEVIMKVERWYGVNISIRNSDIYEQSYTAIFDSESITQVLSSLKITSNISYKIEGKNIILY